MSTSAASASPDVAPIEDDYEGFLAAVRARFEDLTRPEGARARIFSTSASGLFDLFLDNVPASLRQSQTCGTCRTFFERYGALVALSDDGQATPLLWDPERTPAPYTDAVRAVASAVAAAPVASVFLSKEAVWGVPRTGEWEHVAVTPPPSVVFHPSALLTASQTIALKKHERESLVRGLEEFPLDIVRKAKALLDSEALYRGEHVAGVADFLIKLHLARKAAKSASARDNVTWLAVARAPAGFCHVRSTMIGTLLEDLAADMPIDAVRKRFADKMHPLQYMRPTAAPSAGNIAQAEKIVEKLRSEGALARRFARLSDLTPLWVPPGAADRKGNKKGVFSHLRPAPKTHEIDVPEVTITWEKLARTALPDAAQIEYYVSDRKLGYFAFVTAENLEAPPILQWDFEDSRNPVSWYFYTQGSAPQRWNLKVGAYHPVTAVVLQPTTWNPKKTISHHGEKVFFLLDGARDLEYERGCGFFPEFLRSEYHPIRATLEAHAKGAVVSGRDEGDACGLGLSKGSGEWNITLRITTKSGVRGLYKLDRWD